MEKSQQKVLIEYYGRLDIQKEIVKTARNKEAAGSYNGKGYSKRPDVLENEGDILFLVKKGITSFHLSEENWHNPINISKDMDKRKYDDLRSGWDLILDIDCPNWEISKTVTNLFIQSLKDHGIRSITCKFSGNKGFHIAVPFEVFPDQYDGLDTDRAFPRAAREISAYLLEYISKNLITVTETGVSFLDRFFSFEGLRKMTGKSMDDLTERSCPHCGKKITDDQEEKVYDYLCPNGHPSERGGYVEFKTCRKCGALMDSQEVSKKAEKCCNKNTQGESVRKFKAGEIVEVDTVLISPRHLFRAPYSFHEKSGLASIPVPIEKVLSFEKESARLEKVKIEFPFLDRENKSVEAETLFSKALSFFKSKEEKEKESRESNFNYSREVEVLEKEIPRDFFPPCIKNIFSGIKDGRKRALFCMINFLRSCGYSLARVEEVVNEWNDSLPESVRQVYINGQIKSQNKRIVLPPNCNHSAYYKDLQVCTPDNLCMRIRNPVQYAKLQLKIFNTQNKKTRGKKSKETASEKKKEEVQKDKTKEEKEK